MALVIPLNYPGALNVGRECPVDILRRERSRLEYPEASGIWEVFPLGYHLQYRLPD
ncbi:MAG: hypothetical protein RBR28_14045 [Lentimicrobium sp.]|jgi:hypothetical protein|nr:hypothetical protein [Lentimicrobium sp.]